MKIIKYKFLSGEVKRETKEGTVIEPIILEKAISCSDSDYESCLAIAKKEAYNGAVTVEEPSTKEKLIQELAELEAYLRSTDYMAIKCGELGLSMMSEYPTEYIERQRARDRINEIRALLKTM